jgi:hypothetical protein
MKRFLTALLFLTVPVAFGGTTARSWLPVRNAPTFFGKISFETGGFGFRRPGACYARRCLSCRSGHFAYAAPLRSVAIGGTPWTNFRGEEIMLPEGQSLEMVATFLE